MKDIMSTVHEGERIIPAADNAALMQGETIQLEASRGVVSSSSKRELLEQILAEQRKTNELLGSLNAVWCAVTEGWKAMRVEEVGA